MTPCADPGLAQTADRTINRGASGWIASQLQIQASTASEWIRVGHALRYLPLIDAAFAAHEISYARVRILSRWADDDNEARLLELARERNASRLTVAIARALADDGTPTTSHAVLRQLGDAFIRVLIHDAERRPINASSRQRLATTRQKRVVMETHGHECVDCQRTDLLEPDHNPAFERTRRTVTLELEPRCSPCHRARHRHDRVIAHDTAA